MKIAHLVVSKLYHGCRLMLVMNLVAPLTQAAVIDFDNKEIS